MYIICLLLFNVLVLCVRCYNLDFEYAVAKSGPKDSLFGFSVAEHQDKTKDPIENWILVGAPRADDDNLKTRFKNTGAVYKCRSNDPLLACLDQVSFDKVVTGKNFNKTNEWLGVSLKAGGSNRDVVTCAHRYEFFGRSGEFRLLEGKCYALEENMIGAASEFSPCNKNNLRTSLTSDHRFYGQCQSGVGLDILPGIKNNDETNVVIGAPGTRWWSGEIFEMDTDDAKSSGVLPQKTQTDILEGDKLEYRNSLFGYSVTHGNFISKTQLHIAAGGPRHKHFGKVLIYTQKTKTVLKVNKEEEELKTLVQEIPGNYSSGAKIQIASGFGISLCAIDANNDGLSELIVGAPFYLSSTGKDRPERGLVYIYVKSDTKDELVFKKTIQGSEKHGSYSNFGYAVSNAGDINLDGYEDLVVGAPREEDGAGAVYIYLGTKDGLHEKYIQRIAASAVHSGLTDNIGLKGFGRSIGSGVDLDENGYKDILVGAYLSDKVVLLRSRPIIKVQSTLEFSPNQLDSSIKTCDLSKPSSCTNVKLCFNVSEPSGQLKLNSQVIRVKYEITADPLRGSLRKSRVQFKDTGKNTHSFMGNSTLQYKCQELGTIQLVYNEDGSIVEYPDVMFRVSYQIPYTDGTVAKPTRSDAKVVSLSDYPILQKNFANEADQMATYLTTTMLSFKRNCTTCIPDLKLTSEKTKYTLRLRSTQKYKRFDVTIENIGEDTAYSVGLEIKLPATLKLNDILMGGKSLRGGCPNNKCQNVLSKLNKGGKQVVSIDILTHNFDPEGEKNISILVTSANAEKPATTDNNKLEVLFDLKAVADLELFTSQKTKSISYEGEVKGESVMKSLEDAGPYVTHTYTVKNSGPDISQMANLSIFWPYETLSGKHLLYLVDVISKGSCVVPNKNVLNLQGDGTTTFPSTSPAVGPAPLSVSMKSSSVATKKKKTRTRRETINGTDVDVPVTSASTQKKGVILNCTSAKCLEIKCTLTDIEPYSSKTVEIRSVLWKPSLILDYLGEELTIISNGQVIAGINASYISDPDINNQEQEEFTVVTPIIPKKIPKKILVWQIALAVVAGVILLALMVFGLYKVGFFHRTRKHDQNGADQTLLKDKK